MDRLNHEVINHYEIGEVINTHPLGGYMNRNTHLQTSQGQYVLRQSNTSRREVEVAFEVETLKGLKETGFADFVVGVVQSRNDTPYVVVDGQINTLFEFHEDEDNYGASESGFSDLAFVEDLAHKCALLHRSLAELPNTTAPNQGLDIQMLGFIDELKNRGHDFSHLVDLARSMKSDRLVHTDIRLKNLITTQSKVRKIIDFDDLTNGNPLYDLAWVIKECFTEKDQLEAAELLDARLTRAFLKVYQEALEQSLDEQEVFEAMKLACIRALSFLYQNRVMPLERREKLIQFNLRVLSLLESGILL